MDELIYQSSPEVTFASNTFVNVPTILQFDDTPLVSVVREEHLGFTTEIPIYDQSGVYLAKVRGTRVYSTPEGKEAGVRIRQLPELWICEVDDRTAFEIRQQPGNAFRTDAELYTPTGHFLKVSDSPTPEVVDASGNALTVGGNMMTGCVVQDFRGSGRPDSQRRQHGHRRVVRTLRNVSPTT